MYTVETGDSFWSIATQHYGDGRLFRALYHWNIDVVGDFESPTPGMRLQIPAQQQLVARLSEFCPEDLVGKQPTMVTPSQTDAPTYNPASNEHLYTTREGDTLFEIAGDRLGQASRYMDIIAANDDRLPANVTHLTRLAGGLELVLPLSH